MKHYNRSEMTEKLRIFIATKYKRNVTFAREAGCSPQFVTNVINGKRKIPESWLELMGYESVIIYRKSKSE